MSVMPILPHFSALEQLNFISMVAATLMVRSCFTFPTRSAKSLILARCTVVILFVVPSLVRGQKEGEGGLARTQHGKNAFRLVLGFSSVFPFLKES